MRLPAPRGPISTALFACLAGAPGPVPAQLTELADALPETTTDARSDEDVQISLWVCYGLTYAGFEGVDERWEWQPSLLAVRGALEAVFERDILADVEMPAGLTPAQVPMWLMEVCGRVPMEFLKFMHRTATLEQFKELVITRSIDALHEGDAHTWAIPRVSGRAKSALIEIQADEYGGGMPGRSHAELYVMLMSELGLDPEYGAYIEQIPAVALALHNIRSMFGLQQRWRGGLLGNLAATEIGSSIINRHFSEGLDRLGGSKRARLFYDEHILADAVHEQLAAHDMCGGFVADYPDEWDRVVLGALATLNVRGLFAGSVVDPWAAGGTSLRELTTV
ncbi:iron-containing redox enzyme family protein [Dactylosporangium sp. NPDC048998]|uniref:iron-containing redox enzyme family protein n=1 Tax=Dactylosporangium sp. NPDC048998 TaxID=3363976 RepID=UPI00371F03A6